MDRDGARRARCDVVDLLRETAKFHIEKAQLSVEAVKRVTHAGLAALLTMEADDYDVSIMQALLDHEAGDAHAVKDETDG